MQKTNLPPIVFFSDGFDWDLKANRYYFPYYWSFKTKVLVVVPHSSFHLTLKRIFAKQPPFFKKVKKNLYVFQPGGFLPLNKTWDFSQNISYKITKFILKKLLKKLKINDPILWFFYPEIFKKARKIKHSFSIYHLVDQYWQYPFYYPKKKDKLRAKKINQLAAKKSDLVLTSSLYLYQNFKPINTNTFLIENGAETEFILKRIKQVKKKHEDLKKIKPPIIGFVGNMSDFRFDFSLIKFLVKSLKNINFVLIGPSDQNKKIKELSLKFSNCFYLESKPFKQIPQYLKFFDVCIIPYKKNKYTKGVLPIKLFEYFAAGKPVVATNLYSLAPFKKLIYLADNKNEFVLKLKRALKEKSEKLRRKRRKIAKNHTWRKIVNKSEKLLFRSIRFHFDFKRLIG